MKPEVSWQHLQAPATKGSVQVQGPLQCFWTWLTFLRWGVVSTSLNPSKLQDHPLSVLRNCLFGILAATLHIWRSFWAAQGKCFDRRSAINYGTTALFHVLPNSVFVKGRGNRRSVILSGTQNTTETWPLRKPETIRTLFSPKLPWCCRIMLGVLPISCTLLSTYSLYRVCSLTFDFVKTCRKLNVSNRPTTKKTYCNQTTKLFN
jgi:hypothetical protein